MSIITNRKKNKFKAAPFLINAVVFFIGGLGALEEEKFYFTLVLFITSLVNLLVIKTNDRNIGNFLVMVLNSILALGVGIELVIAGKNYIQYVWFLTFLLSFGVAIISLMKYKKAKEEARQPVAETDSTKE